MNTMKILNDTFHAIETMRTVAKPFAGLMDNETFKLSSRLAGLMDNEAFKLSNRLAGLGVANFNENSSYNKFFRSLNAYIVVQNNNITKLSSVFGNHLLFGKSLFDSNSYIKPLKIHSVSTSIQRSQVSLWNNATRFNQSFANLLHAHTSNDKSEIFTVLSEAAIEIEINDYTIKAIAIDDNEQLTAEEKKSNRTIAISSSYDIIMPILNSIDNALGIVYQGAIVAFDSTNPDRLRQVLLGLRTTYENLLRLLAPDDEAKAWIYQKLDAEKKIFKFDEVMYEKDGKPHLKRAGRLFYIYRNMSEHFLDFIKADVQMINAIFDFCNKLHAINHGMTEKDITDLIIRSNSFLMTILSTL